MIFAFFKGCMREETPTVGFNSMIYNCIGLILLFYQVLAVSSCDNRSKKENQSVNDEALQQPKVAAFEPALQNKIFINLLEEVNNGTCTEEKSKPETRLLSSNEYILATKFIFDISIDEQVLKSSLPAQTVIMGYEHLRQFNILSPEKLETYGNVNKTIVESFISRSGQNVINCGSDAKICVKRWLKEKLPIIWRMEIDEETIDRELAFFTSAGGNIEAFSELNERLLLSPYFLYRRNFGLSGQLSSWEVASTLSDVLWAGQLTDELVQLANNKQLSNETQIRQQAIKMIADDRFYEGLDNFVRAWMTTKVIDSKNFAGNSEFMLNEQLKNDLTREASAYLYYLIRTQQDNMNGIFGSNFTIGSSAEAQLFGFSQADNIQLSGLPGGLVKLAYPQGRVGLLSQPSFAIIASNLAKTNPALRGKNVLEKFLCHNLETPDNLGEIVANTKFDTNVSVIDAFDKATGSGSCGQCHQYVNGVGFGMEDMASTGQMQSIDNHQKPVVPNGELLTLSGERTTFNGIAGLNEVLGASQEVEVCIVVQAFRMIHGRLEEERDICTIASAYKTSSQGALRFNEVFTNLLTQKSFLSR